jgi:hypothetical protein
LPFRLIMSGFRSLNIVRSAGDVLILPHRGILPLES